MELVAHWEACVARLTSSKTRAMAAPLYRIQDACAGATRAYIQSVLKLRSAFAQREHPLQQWGPNALELWNMTQSANKTTALLFTMSLQDFHSLFLGRLSESGNELEVREVATKMCEALHAAWPQHILSTPEYIQQGNAAKSNAMRPAASVASPPSAQPDHAQAFLVSETVLTPRAHALFRELNIDTAQCAAHQLTEFRSRITYLSFPSVAADARAFLHRMLFEYSHLSVLDASVVGMAVRSEFVDNRVQLLVLKNRGALTPIDGGYSLCSLSLKGWHRLINLLLPESAPESCIAQIHQLLVSHHYDFALPQKKINELV